MRTVYQAIITKQVEFDAGHRVHQHGGKCANIHGHRYKVEVGVRGEVNPDPGTSEGMVLDFGDLKTALMDIHDHYDHKLILCVNDPLANPDFLTQLTKYNATQAVIIVDFIPTAENMAIEFWKHLQAVLSVEVVWVKVWETPTSMAQYEGVWIEEIEDVTAT